MKSYILPFLFLALFVACSRKTADDSPVVASVGKDKLTINDIESLFYNETGLNISDTQIHRYVQRWIENELIYREALESGLKENPEVQKRLLDLEKDYLVNRFINDYNNTEITITDRDVLDYYNSHKDDFIRTQDLYSLRIILVENYRSASTLRGEIAGGSDFTALAKNHSLDGSGEKGGLLGWMKISELDDEVAKQILRLSPNEVSSPVKTEQGYYLIQLLDIRPKDEAQTLEEVEPLVVSRLRVERKRELYENLISALGEKYEMNSNFEILKKYNKNSTN